MTEVDRDRLPSLHLALAGALARAGWSAEAIARLTVLVLSVISLLRPTVGPVARIGLLLAAVTCVVTTARQARQLTSSNPTG